MEDKIADKSEWVKYLPTEFKIANHTFSVNQYSDLYVDNTWVYGCLCYKDLEICIRIKDGNDFLSEEIIRNTYWHEVFHAFNYLWNTELDESLAQSFANFMRELESTSNYAQKK